jgi:hypothetical protein
MAYLTESEITSYTTLPSVTMTNVESASLLIDAYMGSTFASKEYTEVSRLSKKRTPYGDVFKGKLKHLPRINVVSVTAYVPSPFGDEALVTYDPVQLRFDEDVLQYYTFIPQRTVFFPSPPPYQLIIKYNAGYTTYPEELKRATGMIADSLKKFGGTMNWKSRDDFDCKITLANDSIFTPEIKALIDLVRLS